MPAGLLRWGLPGVSAASTFISGLIGRFRFMSLDLQDSHDSHLSSCILYTTSTTRSDLYKRMAPTLHSNNMWNCFQNGLGVLGGAKWPA